MLDRYRKQKEGWSAYEKAFLKLLAEREVEKRLDPALFDHGCLLWQ
jgi:hypothetical protein